MKSTFFGQLIFSLKFAEVFSITQQRLQNAGNLTGLVCLVVYI